MAAAFPSNIRVANMALGHLGISRTIETLEEKVPEAKQAKLWYDAARIEVLGSYNWNFARKRLALAEHGDEPPEGIWTYRYQYPADCVQFRQIANPSGPDADAVPYDIESSTDGTKSILTNMEVAVGIYTYDLSDTTLFSVFFGSVLSHRLASYMAMPLTSKRSIQQDQLNIYLGLLRTLPGHDANESMQAPPRQAPWISGSGR